MARPVAVVTGASAGVGRAIVQALVRDGYDVAMLARGAAGLESAVRDVAAAGGRGLAIRTDVADWDEMDAAATRVERELGPIALWVNDAMTTVFGRFWEVEPKEFRRATEVTYLGQVHGTMAALARMRPRDAGRIVNIGSSLAFVGIPGQSAYCGAKFACRGFTESVRAELLAERSRITVSLVHLPAVNTPQFSWCESKLPNHPQPVPPIYQPEVAAKFVAQAAGDGRRSKVIGAWNKLIVLGAQVAPDVIAHYAARTGIDSQQTAQPVEPGRPSDLWEPVDTDHDVGSHGVFDDRAGGVMIPAFLRSVPGALAMLVTSAAAAASERRRAAARGRAREERDSRRPPWPPASDPTRR